MHAIKGGWVGQTFAMARSTDTGGKKARIRRSKEERKAMVESYIKRYQKSNNGNFPSLNLTHKEVGGSFYTVREIVREIIQENRVLGPGILSAEEQNNYSFSEQYPLGSISTEPQIQMLSSEESHVIEKLNQGTTGGSSSKQRGKEDLVHNGNPVASEKASDGSSTTLSTLIVESIKEKQRPSSSELMPGPITEHHVNEDTVTLNEANVKEEESDEPMSDNALPIHHEVTSSDQLQSSIEQLSQSEVVMSTCEDVASRSSQPSFKNQDYKGYEQEDAHMHESLINMKDGAKEEEVIEAAVTQMPMGAAVETFPLRPISKVMHSMDERSGEAYEITSHLELKTEDRVNSVDSGSTSSDEKGHATEEGLRLETDRANFASPTENSNGSTMNKDLTDLSGASFAAGKKPVKYPHGNYRENLNAASTNGSSKGLKPWEATSFQNRLNVQHDDGPNKGSNPTLNRINLETWEGKSRKSAGSETNPLLALFKAFVTAFVKFWTE